MIKVAYDSSFKRSYKRKVPFDKTLRTHKLSGKLKEYWSVSIEYDLRVIFYFEDAETAVFVDLGTHKEVY